MGNQICVTMMNDSDGMREDVRFLPASVEAT